MPNDGLWERSAINPPELEALREIAGGVTALRKQLAALTELGGAAATAGGLVEYLDGWGEFVIYSEPSEYWIGRAVAFMLRDELLALHAELTGGAPGAPPGKLCDPPALRGRLTSILAARPDVRGFVRDCAQTRVAFAPGADEAERKWTVAVLDEIARELALHEPGARGRGPLSTPEGGRTRDEAGTHSKCGPPIWTGRQWVCPRHSPPQPVRDFDIAELKDSHPDDLEGGD